MKKFNLQHFADGEESNTEQAGVETNESTEDNNQGQNQENNEKTFTQSEVDKIVEKRLARERKQAQERESEAQRLASMNEKERADYEKNNLLEENKKLKAQLERGNMLQEARTMLANEKVSVADGLIEMLISDDADKTKENITSFVALFRESIKTEVANQLKGGAPKAGNQATITKEQILAVKDQNERQRLIRENIDLFN